MPPLPTHAFTVCTTPFPFTFTLALDGKMEKRGKLTPHVVWIMVRLRPAVSPRPKMFLRSFLTVNYVEGLVEGPSAKRITGTEKVRKNFGAPNSVRLISKATQFTREFRAARLNRRAGDGLFLLSRNCVHN